MRVRDRTASDKRAATVIQIACARLRGSPSAPYIFIFRTAVVVAVVVVAVVAGRYTHIRVSLH